MELQAAVDRWRETRARIWSRSDTAFLEGGPESERARLDELLDDVIQPEFYRAMGIDPARMRWSVWRQDDHGTQYEVLRSIDLDDANARLRDLVSREHKQMYWVALTVEGEG